MEQRRAVAAHQGPAQGEGLAAGVGEDSGGDALGRAAPLVFVNLISYEQVEEAPHVVLHVVRERIPLGAPAQVVVVICPASTDPLISYCMV